MLGLLEPLLAFLAGGGEPLAERAGEAEAERFCATGGGGETDLDLDNALLIGWGLGDTLGKRRRSSFKKELLIKKMEMISCSF